MRSPTSLTIRQAAHSLQQELTVRQRAGDPSWGTTQDAPRGLGGIVSARLRVNVGWSVFGSVTYAACQWGTLVVLAKLASPEDVGRYAFALAVSAPIMMFLQLQLRTVQVTDAAAPRPFADYLALRAVSSVTGIGIVLAAVAIAGHSPSSLGLLVLVTCIKAVDGVADIFYGEWQKRERMDVPARLQMCNGVFSVALLAAALLAGWPAGVAIGGSLAASAATLGAAACLTRKILPRGFRPDTGLGRRSWALARLALPLGAVMALISLTANIPRYFIEAHSSTRELGIFAALLYVTTAGMTLITAIGNSLTPRLAREFGSGDYRAFKRLLVGFVAVAAAIGGSSVVLALAAGEGLLLIAYGPVYAAAANVFVGVMVFGAVSYMASAVGFALSAARCFRAQAPLFVGVTVTVLVASAVWIPRSGMWGGTAALTLGALVQLCGGAAVLSRTLRKPMVLS